VLGYVGEASGQEAPGAQAGSDLSPAAQALFEQAMRLMDEGRFSEACPKLKEVVRLYPPGVGGKLRLAECYEAAGLLASAWAAYHSAEAAAALAGQAARSQKAAARASEIEPRLSRLTIIVPESLATTPELRVTIDDRLVAPAEWGAAVPIDGGVHVVATTAAGKAPWEARVEVASEAARVDVTVALGDAIPVPPDVAPTGAPPPAKPRVAQLIPPWAWGTSTGGLGLAIVGAALRIDVQVVQSYQEARCNNDLLHCARADPTYHPGPDNNRKHLEFGLFVGFTTAGAVAVASTVAAVVAMRAARPTSERSGRRFVVTPVVSTRAGGLGASGEF
jgi:hypothetical protein